MNTRENFSGKLGFILSCIGCAVGLGNIWMFPWRLGTYGGAAFLIPYFIFVFTLGTTGIIGEIALGRSKQQGSYGCIQSIFKEKNLKGSSILGLIPTIAITGTFLFYPIVLGWILKYFSLSLTDSFKHLNISNYFNNFAGTSNSISWHFAAVILTVLIVALGVVKGIEKLNKIAMPALFILFFILLVRSLTLPGAEEGIKYLLVPRWSYLLNPKTWIMALGQAFFTVSLNGAGMVVYGSYLHKSVDIPHSAIYTVIFDTLSALLAAFIIIPAAFALGLDPASGPSLLFITLPHVFKAMPGGYIFGIIFFLSILLAAVSSAINLLEGSVEAFMGKTKLNRLTSTIITAILCFIVSIPLDLSMNSFGRLSDIVTVYLTPIGAVMAAITFYWIYGEDNAFEEINLGSKSPLGNWFKSMGKYVFTSVAGIIVILGFVYGGIG